MKSGSSKIESQSSYRNTELIRLPYFSPTEMLVIDPMHNLFLGTAKYVLKSIWIDNKIVAEDDLAENQARIDAVTVPSDMGRIHIK